MERFEEPNGLMQLGRRVVQYRLLPHDRRIPSLCAQEIEGGHLGTHVAVPMIEDELLARLRAETP